MSIKKVLQLWFVATLVIIMMMAMGGLYTNTLFTKNQLQLVDKILPTSDINRQISHLATALATREKKISMTQLTQLDENHIEQDFGALFDSRWQTLSASLESKNMIDSANAVTEYYEQFIALDKHLISVVQDNFDDSKLIGEKIKQLAEQRQRLNHATAQLEQQLPPDLYQPMLIKILRFNNLVLEVEQHYQSSTALDRQRQAIKTAFTALQDWLLTVKRSPDFLQYQHHIDDVLTHLASIETVSITGEQSIYYLRYRLFANSALLQDRQQQTITALTDLVDELNTFSLLVKSQTLDEVDKSNRIAENARLLMLSLVILLAIIMAYFISTILNGIQSPLAKLRDAMSALSAGRFETRLDLKECNNEFKVLATDFNQFAQITETLINELDTAKLTLEARELELTAILNGVPEAVITLTEEGRIESTNPYAEKVLKADHDKLIGLSFTVFFDEEEHATSINELIENGTESKEFKGVNYHGEPFTMWLSVNPITQLNQRRWVCVLSDITSWKETELQLKKTSTELDTIFENAMVGIAFMKDRQLLRVNRKFEDIFGYQKYEMIGNSPRKLCIDDASFEQLAVDAYSSLEQGETYQGELQFLKKNGDIFWCGVSCKAVSDKDPQEGTLWLYEDITKQRENDEKLRDLASLDTLTRLPNRGVFNDRLMHAIHKAQRDAGRLAIFFLDLDHFKHINDSLGHKAGDQLLCEVAKRLKSCVRAGDTVARLGGDEFTILLEDVQSAQYVAKIAEKVIDAVVKTYILGTTEVNISPSIGVSLYPADGRDVDVLVRNADAAMYHAKNNGRNNFQFYSAEMNAQAAHRLAMETSLRRAVEQEDFFLHFQPQIDLDNKKIMGAEVLIRWHSKQWGHVSPVEFIPILEDTGLIDIVGEYVLLQACEAYMRLKDKLDPDFKIAVNLSGRQFKGTPLAVVVQKILTQTGMSARNLELEITESILMEDTELANRTLSQLSELGVTLAVDDFGTGYSSLSYLKQFPLNVLKIDKSFIDEVTEPGGDDAAIVDAILAMSEHLHLEVIAEGIETVEQLAFLEQRQCHRGQGYFFSRPLSYDDFERLIESKHITV